MALGLVLTGCGGSGGGGDPVATDEETPGGATGSEEEDAAGTPQSGGTLVYGTFSEIEGLDPVMNGGGGATGGVQGLAVFDALTRVTPDGEVEPFLAESLESDDGQHWTLRLREGIEFTDGTPLDAEAVVFNVERHQDPELNSKHSALVQPITSMTAVDDLTVEFELAFPWAAFPKVLSEEVGQIGSPTAIEELGDDFNLQPVGAGPFVVDEWSVDDQLVMSANPDYWQEDRPYLDELVFRPLSDFQTRFASVRSGDVDITYDIGYPAELEEAESDPNLEVRTVVGNGGEGLMFNTDVAPFDDVRIRRAVAHAIDYDALNQVRFGGRMAAEHGLFRPDSPWHSGVEYPGTDREQAGALVQEYLAENGGGDRLTVEFGMIADRKQYAELVQQLLQPIGIDVEIVFMDIAEYVPNVFGGDYEFTGWALTDFSDPDLGLYSGYHSDSPRNASNFDDPEMDAALDTGRSSLDPDARGEAYAEVDRIMAEQVPYVFTNPSVANLIHATEVRGLEPSRDLRFTTAGLWVED